MQPLNLAQGRIAERRTCRRYVDGRIRGIALLAAVAVMVAVGSMYARAGVRRDAAKIKLERDKVEARSDWLESEIAESCLLLSQREWRDTLADGSRGRIAVLHNILVCAPENVWLDQVETGGKAPTVTVTGMAASYRALSQFASRLRSNPRFTDAHLSDARAMEQGTEEHVCFTMEIQVRPSETSVQSAESTQQGGVPQVEESM